MRQFFGKCALVAILAAAALVWHSPPAAVGEGVIFNQGGPASPGHRSDIKKPLELSYSSLSGAPTAGITQLPLCRESILGQFVTDHASVCSAQ